MTDASRGGGEGACTAAKHNSKHPATTEARVEADVDAQRSPLAASGDSVAGFPDGPAVPPVMRSASRRCFSSASSVSARLGARRSASFSAFRKISRVTSARSVTLGSCAPVAMRPVVSPFSSPKAAETASAALFTTPACARGSTPRVSSSSSESTLSTAESHALTRTRGVEDVAAAWRCVSTSGPRRSFKRCDKRRSSAFRVFAAGSPRSMPSTSRQDCNALASATVTASSVEFERLAFSASTGSVHPRSRRSVSPHVTRALNASGSTRAVNTRSAWNSAEIVSRGRRSPEGTRACSRTVHTGAPAASPERHTSACARKRGASQPLRIAARSAGARYRAAATSVAAADIANPCAIASVSEDVSPTSRVSSTALAACNAHRTDNATCDNGNGRSGALNTARSNSKPTPRARADPFSLLSIVPHSSSRRCSLDFETRASARPTADISGVGARASGAPVARAGAASTSKRHTRAVARVVDGTAESAALNARAPAEAQAERLSSSSSTPSPRVARVPRAARTSVSSRGASASASRRRVASAATSGALSSASAHARGKPARKSAPKSAGTASWSHGCVSAAPSPLPADDATATSSASLAASRTTFDLSVRRATERPSAASAARAVSPRPVVEHRASRTPRVSASLGESARARAPSCTAVTQWWALASSKRSPLRCLGKASGPRSCIVGFLCSRASPELHHLRATVLFCSRRAANVTRNASVSRPPACSRLWMEENTPLSKFSSREKYANLLFLLTTRTLKNFVQ